MRILLVSIGLLIELYLCFFFMISWVVLVYMKLVGILYLGRCSMFIGWFMLLILKIIRVCVLFFLFMCIVSDCLLGDSCGIEMVVWWVKVLIGMSLLVIDVSGNSIIVVFISVCGK